jgi:hypothetical protein
LPSFEITRGGLRYVKAPLLSEWSGATAVWSESTDAEPGSATKPIKSLVCGTEEQVFANAIPTRIGWGNMQARFAPEQMAANMDTALAEAARIAENELLTLLEAACVKNITTATLLGATRDIVTAINQGVAAYRNIHRIADSQAITVVLPRWSRELIKTDLARESAHAQSSDFNSLAVTDEDVTTILRAHGVNPIFHLDGQAEPTSKNYPSQIFVGPAEGQAIKPFPAKMAWYLFPEGSVQFLDGGRLDLGVIRDTTLDATNDMETMVEPFEALAYRGFEHGAWQLVSSLCGSGMSAGTESTAGKCA